MHDAGDAQRRTGACAGFVCMLCICAVQDRFTQYRNHIIKHYGRKYDKQITILVQNEIIARSQKA